MSTTLVVTITDSPLAAADDDVVDEVVSGIKAAQAKHGFALAQDIGRLIVDRFYGGDVNVLRQRGPKDASLRKLAQHPHLPMSAAALHNAVSTFEYLERRPDVYSSKHLTPTHVRTVLALPAPDQDRLLEKAENKALTVEQLAAEANKAKAKHAKGGGRPMLPAFVKTIHALGKYVDNADELFGGLEAIEALHPVDAQSLLQTVTGLRARCEGLETALVARAQTREVAKVVRAAPVLDVPDDGESAKSKVRKAGTAEVMP